MIKRHAHQWVGFNAFAAYVAARVTPFASAGPPG